uniref:Reverse transcriptase n=1 Tax=Naja naja TaxID=35670 RepID=A0A8C6XIC2_NAJNA
MEKKKGIAQEFFKELYKQEQIRDEKINHYLKGETMSVLMEEERVMLNRNITIEELREVIQKQKNNKTPGMDGLPGEVYKSLGETIDLILLEVCNVVLTEARLPESWRAAYIALIPKEGTDTTQIKNYRPISLLIFFDCKRFDSS